ncbi:hypothetical protein PSTG_09106 [Puccinia striiformis f. sp. tritici PST-78]|uniref:Uncharacterized protein n=1 Tax=Puccinia striiformis f. sp. tritici PST-78 TaxID=1165861 RepID=A0A0L0VE53_9BASI|nr:hypothetical protein PSTG_09106 [Puccinia striiformis f. sp. tritici PST-78]
MPPEQDIVPTKAGGSLHLNGGCCSVFSSSSQKRKSSSLTDSANKRSVHQLANDVSQRANLIDPPSIRHSVNSSEFSLDHHQSRTSEDKTQTTDSHTIKSNLFDRITLPPSALIVIYV